MTLFRTIYLLATAAGSVAALSLDGSPLRELLVDHGNGTVYFWSEPEHSGLELFTADIVGVPHGLDKDGLDKYLLDKDVSTRDVTAKIFKKFCEGYKAQYSEHLYTNAAQKFCGDMNWLITYYFASVFDIFEHEVCVSEAGHNFACGFILDIGQQAARHTIGPEATNFCQNAFNAIHADCDAKFGGVDASVNEPNGKGGGVEYRSSPTDNNVASCKNIKNPIPGMPFSCKVRSR